MKISITAPASFGSDYITEPHIVQQLWRDVLGELIVPRREDWIETGRELRQSINQNELVTTFEVTDLTCVNEVLIFALAHFVRRRTPSAGYVERRYHGQTDAFRDRKTMEVILRTTLAITLKQVVEDPPMGMLMSREGQEFRFPLHSKVGKSWDDLPAVSHNELVRTLGVPAHLIGDTNSHNLATVAAKLTAQSMSCTVEPKTPCAAREAGHEPTIKEAHPMEPGSLSFTLTTPKKIGPFPMREDLSVQPISEAITECLNRVKKTNCRHCDEEVFWVQRLSDGKYFLADNFKQRRELSNIDGDGNTKAGQQHIVCIPHYCLAMQERVKWPKSRRPAHPLKERLWSLMVQSGVRGKTATQLIESAFKAEVMIPLIATPDTTGEALNQARAAFEKAEEDSKNTVVLPAVEVKQAPVREWGIIREMARLLHETADRGSELNLEDRKRLNVTADLAEAAVAEGAKGAVEILLRDGCKLTLGAADDDDRVAAAESVQAELAKIQTDFKKILEELHHPTIPAGPMLPLPDSEGPD